MSIVTDDRFDFGKVPPPTFALPQPMAIFSGNSCNREQIAVARLRNSLSETRSSASVGIPAVA